MGGELTGIVNEVSASCDMEVVWVGLLWEVVYNNSFICDCLVFSYMVNFIVSHDKEIIALFCSIFVIILGQPTKFISKCRFHTSWSS